MGLRTPRDDCGVIFDFALHDFDVFCFLLNDFPIEVTAIGTPYLREPYEDVGIVTLRFPNNILAHIQVSWLTPKKIRDLWVVGQEKSASLDYMSQDIEIYDIGVVPEYDSFGGFKLITREGDTYIRPGSHQDASGHGRALRSAQGFRPQRLHAPQLQGDARRAAQSEGAYIPTVGTLGRGENMARKPKGREAA